MRFINNAGDDVLVTILEAEGPNPLTLGSVSAPVGFKTDYALAVETCRIGVKRGGFDEVRPSFAFRAGDDIEIRDPVQIVLYRGGETITIAADQPSGEVDSTPPQGIANDELGIETRSPLGVVEQPFYRIGTGIHDITDYALNQNLQGFGADQRTTGVALPLYARAFIIHDTRTNKRVALVCADMWTGSAAVKKTVVDRITASLGGFYTSENIWLAGTHTHSAPGGYTYHYYYNYACNGFDVHTHENYVDGIVNAIEKAHANLEPGRMYVSADFVADCGFNRSVVAYELNPEQERRQHGSSTDNKMLLLKFTRVADGAETPVGLLCWYALHPTNLGQFNRLISGDNKGWASHLLEQSMGAEPGQTRPFIAAFANSNCGDVTGNMFMGRTYTGDFDQDVPHYIPLMQENGQKQHDVARRLFDLPGFEVRGEIDYRLKTVDLRQQTGLVGAVGLSMFGGSTEDGSPGSGLREGITANDLDSLNVLLPLIKTVFKAKAAAHGHDCPAADQLTAQQLGAHAPKPVVFALGEALPIPMVPNVVPLQLIRLGHLALAGVPAEFTTMAGRRLRGSISYVMRPHGVEEVIIGAYANDYCGYVTTPQEYDAQHYEGASTLFGRELLGVYQTELAGLARAMVERQPATTGAPVPLLRPHVANAGRFTVRNLSATAWSIKLWNGDAAITILPIDEMTLPAHADLALYLPPDVARGRLTINGTNVTMPVRGDLVLVMANGQARIVPYTRRPSVGAPAQTTAARRSQLTADQTLLPGEELVAPGGGYRFIYQNDGNLVLYRTSDDVALWASATDGRPVGLCIMQGDGNLVIYGPQREPVWDSSTHGSPGSRLVMQDDGNAVIYRPNGEPIWATNTWQQASPVAPTAASVLAADPRLIVFENRGPNRFPLRVHKFDDLLNIAALPGGLLEVPGLGEAAFLFPSDVDVVKIITAQNLPLAATPGARIIINSNGFIRRQ